MARKREPTLRNEIAASGETPLDEGARAERERLEDLTFLAREFLTWLVFHADTDGGEFAGEGDLPPFAVSFGGRVALRNPAGRVTDMALKGASPADSPDLRYALAGGLAVKEADLRLDVGDRRFELALAAEGFDLKRVKLPALLAEEEEERMDERLALLQQLDEALRFAFRVFLGLRLGRGWARTVVPAMRAWLAEGT